MDYCSSCRRNLNGALVCPGCGDYAPDIAPPTHRQAPTGAEAAALWESWQAPEATPALYEEAMTPARAETAAATAPEAGLVASEGTDVPAATGTGQGRAARRRQLARWKKYRRRAVAATAFALVGGTVTATLLQNNRPATAHAQASAAPDPETVSAPGTPTASEEPDGRASRHPGDRAPLGRHRKPDAAGHSSAPAAAQQPSAAPTHSAPSPGTAPHTAAAPAPGRHAAHTDTAPAAAAPASSGQSAPDSGGSSAQQPASSGADSGSSSTTPTQTQPSTTPSSPSTEPTSPAHLCVLGVVCL
ncbi:SCO2400 family protein [Streptomyces sp. NRRL S-337]|uniref:SCO2400 family protein n=1 Tax=Streptomyces sp. NRRL S-337 TaxID=1463900 RepID=UPI00131C04FD|nr:hypothetical protein [Streptomyces sp. NRRL S-337]